MKILLTGFEAFVSVDENPSQVIVEEFAKSIAIDRLDYADLVCEILPVEYELSKQRICELIDQHKPDAVVMTGVAASRMKINVEFWARNIRTAKIPDNSGVLLKDAPIDSDHPIEHFLPSTLPVATIYLALNRQQIPVERSNNAGGYICNNVFYCAVDHLKKTGRDDVLAGFIHIPLFDAIDRKMMKKAYDLILMTTSVYQRVKHESHLYMNPKVELMLSDMLTQLPQRPSSCLLIRSDGFILGHAGTDVDYLDQRGLTLSAFDALYERVSHIVSNGDFNHTFIAGESGLLFVLRIDFGLLLAVNWDESTSIASVAQTFEIVNPLAQMLRSALPENLQ